MASYYNAWPSTAHSKKNLEGEERYKGQGPLGGQKRGSNTGADPASFHHHTEVRPPYFVSRRGEVQRNAVHVFFAAHESSSKEAFSGPQYSYVSIFFPFATSLSV
jgi:hypothetical protein